MADEEAQYKFIPEGETAVRISSRNYYGRGTAFYPNEDQYEGEYEDGYRIGKGTYTYKRPEEKPSDKYEGDFYLNKKHGIGLMTYVEKNETYYGQWENGKKHGEGIYTYNNKDTYSGWWAFGKKHGKGTYVYAATNQRIEGTWEENKCIEGRWILPNGNYFEGKFENNKPSGNGKWYFKNGNIITGDFKQEAFEDEVDGETVKKYKLSWLTNANLCSSAELINEQERF
ncbi:hypothetical protein ABPG72_013723 [Tetrahymena utriculariae]